MEQQHPVQNGNADSFNISATRLWDSLMAMAEIGPGANGGSHRLTLTSEDVAARNLLIEWVEALGCSWRRDHAGNMFIRREGSDPSLAPVAIGSHLDTQPRGGRFDGVLGVLSGLEVFRTLDEHNVQTRRPLMLINWTNEEGSRFPPAMGGSAVHAGRLSLEAFRSVRDRDGMTLGEALDASGQVGELTPGSQSFDAYLELHIEQGPILEAAGQSIGVVTGIQGIRWYDIHLEGLAAHAGSTPMSLRRDPLAAASEFMTGMCQLARDDSSDQTRITFGELTITSPSRNVIPGDVTLTVDMRHVDDDRLTALHDSLEQNLQQAAERHGVRARADMIWHSPMTPFDDDMIDLLAAAAESLGYEAPRMVSGAGHDAANAAYVTPTVMLFVPCRDGISHNESEYASPEHCAAGAQVMLEAVLARANCI